MTEERLLHRLRAANPVPHLDAAPDRGVVFARILAEPGNPGESSGRVWGRMPRLGGLRATAAATTLTAGALALAVALTTGGAPGMLTANGIDVTGAHLKETAYIVQRVRKDLASTTAGGGVLETSVTYPPDSRFGQQSVSWSWTDPQTGFQYEQTTVTDAAGNPVSKSWDELERLTHDTNGQVTEHGQSLSLDYGTRTYTEGPMTLTYTPAAGQLPSLLSTTDEISQALQNGTVSQAGTTTIDGTAAISLSVTGEVGMTLYVNAQTDQPLRMVLSNPTNSDNEPIITDLQPASQANVANTQEPSIPAGFAPAPAAPAQPESGGSIATQTGTTDSRTTTA